MKEVVTQHHRAGEEEERYHRRVEDRITKSLMNRMTIRMIVVMAGAVTIVGTFMIWVASGQVTEHENVVHREIVSEPRMEVEHKKIEENISREISDLSDEVQDLRENVEKYHEEQQKQYIELLKEIKKIH